MAQRRMRRAVRLATVTGMLMGTFVLPALGAAQAEPREAQYKPLSLSVAASGDEGRNGPGAPGSATGTQPGGDTTIGILPFTGLDLALMCGVALALFGFGVGLQRATSHRDPDGVL